MKLTRIVKVKNALGLHTRPATMIVKILQDCECNVTFTHKNVTINAKSILSILMLALGKNSTIKIAVEGVKAYETMMKLVEGFETHFGELSL